MKLIFKQTKMYQRLAILFFFGSGAGSVYLFYQVPGLWFLQGLDEEMFRTAVSVAWVMIFPVWMALFFAAMALLEVVLGRLDA